MSTTKRQSVARRARRRLARWLAPELEAELKAARGKLSRARAQLKAEQDLPPGVERTIARARAEHLTFLKPEHLRSLAAAVLDIERRRLPGLIVEAGTARGGSAIVMAAAKAPERPMKVYDVFGMIPPPSEHDGPDVHERYATIATGAAKGIGGDTYYGYRDDLFDEVTESFRRLGVAIGEHRVDDDVPGADRAAARGRRPDRARRLLRLVGVSRGGRRVLRRPRRLPARAARQAARGPGLAS
jgi:hypothetical protein